jgi:hypothetical protein
MANSPEQLMGVLKARHETRKQQTETLAKTPTQPREEAVIHTAATTPVKAIRN